jgi:hypothetical protein
VFGILIAKIMQIYHLQRYPYPYTIDWHQLNLLLKIICALNYAILPISVMSTIGWRNFQRKV